MLFIFGILSDIPPTAILVSTENTFFPAGRAVQGQERPAVHSILSSRNLSWGCGALHFTICPVTESLILTNASHCVITIFRCSYEIGAISGGLPCTGVSLSRKPHFQLSHWKASFIFRSASTSWNTFVCPSVSHAPKI